MLKVIGFGLLGLFVVMIFPSAITDEAIPMFYGTAHMVLSDSAGNVLMTQTIHNQVTDEGEEFIIDQVFTTADAAVTGNNRVGALCIIENSDSVFGEGTVAAVTNNLNAPGGAHCHVTSTTIVDAGDSKAVTESEVFTAGTDFDAGETISGIVICKMDGTTGDFAECNTPGSPLALAALDLNNVTVTGTDTITITYTFDITTTGS